MPQEETVSIARQSSGRSIDSQRLPSARQHLVFKKTVEAKPVVRAVEAAVELHQRRSGKRAWVFSIIG